MKQDGRVKVIDGLLQEGVSQFLGRSFNQPQSGGMALYKRLMGISLTLLLFLQPILIMPAKSALNKPSAQLKQVRVRSTSEGMEVILDLSQMPGDLSIQNNTGQNKTGQQITAMFSGRLGGGFKAGLKKVSSPNLHQVYWEARNGKVQVFLKASQPEAMTVYPLEQPSRLIFHVRNRAVQSVTQPTKAEQALGKGGIVASGVQHHQFQRMSARGPVRINVLEVDPKNPFIEIAPALASYRLNSKARAQNIVSKNRAIAGINASFFKPDKGTPVGFMMINGELVSGPIYDRVALGITKGHDVKMARIGMRGEITLPNGMEIKIDNVNQPRVQLNQVVVYSSRWGGMAPPVPKGGFQVQVRNGYVTARSTQASLSIPADGYVVSGPGSGTMAELANLPLDKPVSVNFYTTPDWSDMKHAVAGGPYLVKNGQLYMDAAAQRFRLGNGPAPRTAVGITAAGKLLLVTVDGRQKGLSMGLTLGEMATLMKQLGARDAMNLDGGSSTQMVVEGRLVNSPSVPNGVAVSNCLIIKQRDETTASTELETPYY